MDFLLIYEAVNKKMLVNTSEIKNIYTYYEGKEETFNVSVKTNINTYIYGAYQNEAEAYASMLDLAKRLKEGTCLDIILPKEEKEEPGDLSAVHDNACRKILESEDEYERFLGVLSKFWEEDIYNVVLIYRRNPGAKVLLGYDDWNSLYGRQVKKGEHGIRLLKNGNPVSLFDVSQTKPGQKPENGKEEAVYGRRDELQNKSTADWIKQAGKVLGIQIKSRKTTEDDFVDKKDNVCCFNSSVPEAERLVFLLDELCVKLADSKYADYNPYIDSAVCALSKAFGVDVYNYDFSAVQSLSQEQLTELLSAVWELVKKVLTVLCNESEERK